MDLALTVLEIQKTRWDRRYDVMLIRHEGEGVTELKNEAEYILFCSKLKMKRVNQPSSRSYLQKPDYPLWAVRRRWQSFECLKADSSST